MHFAGGEPPAPSHHTVPSDLSATFVKMAFRLIVAIAFGFVFALVPGATPKKPASGLTAQSLPSGPGRIHAMSSPTVHTRYPLCEAGGTSMARLVFPPALGNAPHTYRTCPSGDSMPMMSICSASQPSLRPRALA